ncbi:MAG: pyridoxal-phosphate dependent enzyme [Planctomycetes bacterium]|nr:pyridoxal-phosphate dependent enzyme [Planctomycetota bacterium]
MPTVRCTDCNLSYPESGLPYRCPACGGFYNLDGPPIFDPDQLEKNLPGIWRFRHTFSLFANSPVISLGEGNTPLVWEKVHHKAVGMKMESFNPTASYKDRGSAVLVSQLLARGITSAVEDSSGNAGASFAAYAARAGLKARVFVPEAASGPKRVQIERFGAELVRVPGPRSEAARRVKEEAEAGATYASHAYIPFGLSGVATIAYEIWEDMGEAPGTVITPVGQGGLLVSVVRGFTALKNRGLIKHVPYYVGVQAKACAPMVAIFNEDQKALDAVVEGATLAEGVRIRYPVQANSLKKEIHRGEGEFIAIEEEEILPAFYDLAQRGFYVEPTSTLAWCGLKALANKLPEPIILVLTGSGLKAQIY